MAVDTYLKFKLSNGQTLTMDGGTLFAASDYSFGATQVLNVGAATSGAGSGNLQYGQLKFTLGSSDAATALDQMLASGKTLSEVDLFVTKSSGPQSGADTDSSSNMTGTFIKDTFKLVGVAQDTVDLTTGSHQFALSYGALNQSYAAQQPSGSVSNPVNSGSWNQITNVQDTSAATQSLVATKALAASSPLDPLASDQIANAVYSAAADYNTYMQIRDANGRLLGGSSNGWIKLDSASVGATHSLNLGTASSGAGRPDLGPLNVSFASGTLDPLLLKALASGQPLEVEIATYRGGQTPAGAKLVDDYRFGTARLTTDTQSQSAGDEGQASYSFVYGQEAVQHYDQTPSGSVVAGQFFGWDTVKNTALTAASADAFAGLPSQQAKTTAGNTFDTSQQGSTGATQYYLQFLDNAGTVVKSDGGSLFAVSDFSFAAEQTVKPASQSGAGIGTVSFGNLSFALGSSDLATKLDQMMANGTAFSQVNVYGFGKGDGSGKPTVQDTFKLARVQSDDLDTGTGQHSFSLSYGGLVQSATPLTPAGTLGTPVTDGWNGIKNLEDKSLVTEIGGGAVRGSGPVSTQQVATGLKDTNSTLAIYMQIRNATGQLLGGGTDGWIKLDSADLGTLQNSTDAGQVAAGQTGHLSFEPLAVSFASGTLDPLLLKTLGSGQALQLEIAAYTHAQNVPGTGGLVDDYRLGTVKTTADTQSVDDTGYATASYQFTYGQVLAQHYEQTTSGAVTAGQSFAWDTALNRAIPASGSTALPTQHAALQPGPSLQISQQGYTGATDHYLQFVDTAGHVVTSDGGSLFEVKDFQFGATQPNANGSSGTGRVSFGNLQFTLGSSDLATRLDAMLASGQSFAAVNVFGYASTNGASKPGAGQLTVKDTFKLASVATDSVNVKSGAHALQMTYGALVQSATSLGDDGLPDQTVTDGWNSVNNVEDTRFDRTAVGTSLPVSSPDLSRTVSLGVPEPDAVDTYMQIRDASGALISGETGWTELESAVIGATQSATNVKNGVAIAGADPLQVTLKTDAISPSLFRALASGQALQIEIATYAKGAGPANAATRHIVDDYRLGTVLVTSDQTQTDENGVPEKTYAFAYGREGVQHYDQTAQGTLTKGQFFGVDYVAHKFIDSASNTLPVQHAGTGDGPTSAIAPDPACFVTGTLVRTPDGERAVETLAMGDVVCTADGTARVVKWMGRRTIDPRATCFANPDAVMPVRIRAGALGEDLPVRDLLLSPDHAVLVEGVLVQAGALVNGVTVVREVPTEAFTYWHVELEGHALILVENLQAETFVSNLTRMGFDNWAEHEALFGGQPEMPEMDTPRVQSARQLPQRVRRLLAARVQGRAEAVDGGLAA